MGKLQYQQHYTLQKFGRDLLMTLIPFFKVNTWKTFLNTSAILFETLSLLRHFTTVDVLLKQNKKKDLSIGI